MYSMGFSNLDDGDAFVGSTNYTLMMPYPAKSVFWCEEWRPMKRRDEVEQRSRFHLIGDHRDNWSHKELLLCHVFVFPAWSLGL